MPMLPIGQGVVYLPTRVFQWLEAVLQGAKQGITMGKTVTQSNANGAPPRCGSRHVHKRYSSLLPVSDDLVGTLDTHALVLSLAVRAPACRPAASAGCDVGALRLAHRERSWAPKASRLVLGNDGCQPLPSWGSCTVRSYACSTRHFSLLQQCRCQSKKACLYLLPLTQTISWVSPGASCR